MEDLMQEAALVRLAQRLVRFPSLQTDRMEAEPSVQAFIGQCVGPLLTEMGIAFRRDAMGNLIAELGPPGAAKAVLVMAYAMTHPAAAMREPFAGEVIATEDGPAVRGRGISEQKGALAASLAALQAVSAGKPLSGRLIFALSTAGETGRHDAARAIMQDLSPVPAFGIVALGTHGRVALGNKGRIDLVIEVGGKAVHSSSPWAGVNAIEGARAVIDRLAGIRIVREHPALGRATLTPTAIESWPKATHTIQDRVRLVYDRRLIPGDDPDAAFDEIVAAVGAIAGPWRITVERGPFMFPAEIPADSAFLRHARAGAAALGAPPPGTFYSHAALDAGYLITLGMQAAMWGPGRMEQFHSDEESLLVSELVDGAKAYLGFLRSALGT